MIEPGTIVERYLVQELIGRGGMASVYRVTHRVLGSDHAFKVLEFTSAEVRERVIQEGRIQARLAHPNILAVHDAFEMEGLPVLVLEYVKGASLDRWLAQNKPTLSESLQMFRGIVRAIRYAHNQGVVHRDLKPANVLLAPTREGLLPKVGDFGLAKAFEDLGGGPMQAITRTGTVMGTPEYQAPEQIRDASKVDQRADLFSLGAILYELVCHERAFKGGDVLEVYKAVASGQYKHPKDLGLDLPPALVACIAKLLKIDPTERFANCQQVLEHLDSVIPTASPVLDAEPAQQVPSWTGPRIQSAREVFGGGMPVAEVRRPAEPTIWDEGPSIALVMVIVAVSLTAVGGFMLMVGRAL
jgi:eukaryotic-like serine/threonine-protein kinase